MRTIFVNPPAEVSEARDLLYGCWCKGKRIGYASFPPLSLLYPATLLKENGHEARLLDAQALSMDEAQTLEAISRYAPDLMVMAIDHRSEQDLTLLAAAKDRLPGLRTAAFGAWTTFSPQESVRSGTIDHPISGEPELPLLQIANRPQEHAKGMPIAKRAPFDSLPIPDRTMLPHPSAYYNPLASETEWTTAITSRGCAYHCTFCTSRNFYGRAPEERGPGSVIEELGRLRELGYREIFFRDEIFTRNRKRTAEICRGMMREGIDLRWIANAHVNHADRGLLSLMKKAGCRVLKFGVESGSQKVLDYYKKGTDLPAIKKAFENARSCGIKTHAHFILGSQMDDKRTVLETVRLAEEIRPATATFNPLRVLKGTELYEKGIAPAKNARKMVSYAYRRFYLRPSYLLQRMASMRRPIEAYGLLRSGLAVATMKESDIQ